MELVRSLFLLLSLVYSLVVEAKTSIRSVPKEAELKVLQVKQEKAEKHRAEASISPEIENPGKFMKKDLPFDKRPKADPFHFGHPYPVVQDSGDYDRDYVKDENSDNGSWKAQETYDRLRTKLRKEKKDLAKALAKKEAEEGHLRDAMKRHDKEHHDKEAAAKEAERLRRERERQKQLDKLNPFAPKQEEDSEDDKNPEAKDVGVSTKETEKAMSNLEDCKKQLAEARQKLKDLMKELEAAKNEQIAADKALDEAIKKDMTEKEHHQMLKRNMDKEYEEYLAAKKAYEKQLALVNRLEIEIKEAEEKVRALRDAADADGGVYPSPRGSHRSGAAAGHLLWALILAMIAFTTSA